MSSAREVWRAVLGDLQLQLPRPTFETWLKTPKACCYRGSPSWWRLPGRSSWSGWNGECTTPWKRLWKKWRAGPWTFASRSAQNPDYYAAEPSARPPDSLSTESAAAVPLFEVRSFNPRYSFDSFVVGPSNQLAFGAAQAVAEAPAESYNPLFLYSGTGLGKTHLLQAIGRVCANRGMSVLYVTSEQFTNDFISAIRNRTTEDFRRRYRSVELLLMDDVQFLSGKEQTHEGFFHTFNDLHTSGNQVVISSDRPPRELPLMEDGCVPALNGGSSPTFSRPAWRPGWPSWPRRPTKCA